MPWPQNQHRQVQEDHEAEGAHKQPHTTEEVQGPMSVSAHERDAQQVEEAAQITLGPIARTPVLPRAMVNGYLRDAVAAIGRENRDEAVELAVEPHPLQHLRAVRLEPAVDVVEVDARDRRRSSS